VSGTTHTRTCTCASPAAQVSAENVAYCDRCGERLPEPSNAVILLELYRLADRFDQANNAPAKKLLTAQELADQLGMSTRFIYKHADELQAVRVGGALRFDLDKAVDSLAPRPFQAKREEA
jgi:hypothetical protein